MRVADAATVGVVTLCVVGLDGVLVAVMLFEGVMLPVVECDRVFDGDGGNGGVSSLY